jgi:hypothetical protein
LKFKKNKNKLGKFPNYLILQFIVFSDTSSNYNLLLRDFERNIDLAFRTVFFIENAASSS